MNSTIKIEFHLLPVLLHVLGELVVLGIVLHLAARHRAHSPVTVRLVQASVVCLLGPLVMIVCLNLGWIRLIAAADETTASTQGITSTQQNIMLWQLAAATFEIAAWSLLAWAILMRPDERRRG